MHIRFMTLATVLTTSVAFAMMDDSAARMFDDFAFIKQNSSPASSSVVAALPIVKQPTIILGDEYMTDSHAAAHIPWPKGVTQWLEAGECAMIVQTNIEPNLNDIYNLLTVPQLIANGMPEELANYERWPADLGGNESTRCKGIMAGMISQMNRQLVAAGSSRGYVLKKENQKIIALAIALAYKDSTYRAHAKWDGEADQLIPFISVDDVHQDTASVELFVNSSGIPTTSTELTR